MTAIVSAISNNTIEMRTQNVYALNKFINTVQDNIISIPSLFAGILNASMESFVSLQLTSPSINTGILYLVLLEKITNFCQIQNLRKLLNDY